MNDDEEFVNRAYFTIRDMYTILRGQEIAATSQGVHTGKMADKVPRFDKILTNVRHAHRSKSTVKAAPRRMLEPAADVEGFLEANRDVFAGAIKTDMKARAEANLRGQGDITSYWRGGNKDPKTTSYMAAWKGL